MKLLTRALAIVFVISTLTNAATSQTNRIPPQEETERAMLVFARILHDDESARVHVSYLVHHMQRSLWDFSTLFDVTQRLAIAGFSITEIDSALTPCGDMASAAANVSDDHFAAIVLMVFSLGAAADWQVQESLDALESSGVPAYRYLAESMGLKLEKVQRYAAQDRIRGKVAKELLLKAFTRDYGGLAAKLAENHATRN